jgi:cytochrome c553
MTSRPGQIVGEARTSPCSSTCAHPGGETRRVWLKRESPWHRTTAKLHARAVALAIAVAVAGLPAAAQGGNRVAGRRKARPCAVCHGPIGISQTPDAPHLAGQPEIYFVDQMKAYRSGKRIHPEMNVVAKPLTDVDINDMAAWYASIKIRAEPVSAVPQRGGRVRSAAGGAASSESGSSCAGATAKSTLR